MLNVLDGTKHPEYPKYPVLDVLDVLDGTEYPKYSKYTHDSKFALCVYLWSHCLLDRNSRSYLLH